jgi:hypothetical protein
MITSLDSTQNIPNVIISLDQIQNLNDMIRSLDSTQNIPNVIISPDQIQQV